MLAIGLKQGGAKRGCHVPEATLTPLNLSRIEVHARGILRPRRCRCASCRPLRWCFRSGAFAHGVERCRVPPGTTNVCNFFSHECAHPCICARRARALAVALSKSHYALAGVAAWRVERAVLVPAAHPPVCSLLPLSLVDAELYMVGGPCCGTLFFREQLDSEALQRTLAVALEALPVLAGRVVSLPPPGQPHVRRTGEWRRGYPRAVQCCNSGAGFTVLHCPGVALPTDRSVDRPPPFPAMWQGKNLYEMTDNPDDHILDCLQVNFATGCMISVSAPHAILDGGSIAAFVHLWSELLKGVPPEQLPRPLVDRSVYDTACGISGQVHAHSWQARAAQPGCICLGKGNTGGGKSSPRIPLTDHTDIAPNVDSSPRSSSGSDDGDAAAARLSSVSPLGGMTVWPSSGAWARLLLRAAFDPTLGLARGASRPTRLLLRLPGAVLKRLKAAAAADALAAGSAAEANRMSTNDAYTAVLWRILAAARRTRGALDMAPRRAETLCFVANTRPFVLPSEQQVFIGNATAIVQCALPAAELQSRSLGNVAAVVRRCKASLTPHSVRAEMAYLQAHADSGERNIMWHTLPIDGRCVLWDWTKFPLFDYEFAGHKPFWFEPGLGAPLLLPHVMGAAPSPDGDGLLVFANIPADECEAVLAAICQL